MIQLLHKQGLSDKKLVQLRDRSRIYKREGLAQGTNLLGEGLGACSLQEIFEK